MEWLRNILAKGGSSRVDKPSLQALNDPPARELGPVPALAEGRPSFNPPEAISFPEAHGDSSSHGCPHCERVQISVNDDLRAHYSQSRRKWQYTLTHTMAEASTAASDGCPFFVWLWREITRSQTPAEQLLNTQIQLEFETGETVSGLVAENSHAVTVTVSTKHYSWPVAHFDVVSPFDDPSADHAVARAIVGDVSAISSLDQIQRRLDYCRRYHPDCNSELSSVDGNPPRPPKDTPRARLPTPDPPRPDSPQLGTARAVPLRFLNVDPSRSGAEVTLVRADPASSESYVTLSYVWGQDQAVKTTLGTMVRHKCGIPIASLPKTIRDAIRVTRHLGVHLLWVDSLCIVQDDVDELAGEIANMSSYYSNSLVTISAAAAKSCAEGFLESGSNSGGSGGGRCYKLPFRSGETRQGYIKLLPFRSPSSEAIDVRAWTLQEGLMSTRVVSIGKDSISWSCPSAEYGKIKIGRLRKLFQESKTGSLSFLREATLFPSLKDEMRILELGLHYLDAWDEIVCEYCDRHLSEATDGLVAISGIALEFSSSIRPPQQWDADSSKPLVEPETPRYVAGMWRSVCLPLQLLWRPLTRCATPSPGVYVAPSWSWASARAPLRRDKGNYITWLARAEVRDFKIKSCHLHLCNESAPFGALASGFMMVEGRASYSYPLSLYRTRKDIQVTLDTGEDSSNPEFLNIIPTPLRRARMTLLEVVSAPPEVGAKAANMMDFPRGLVLSKTSEGYYRRVGLFFMEGSGPDIDWEMRTFTLF